MCKGTETGQLAHPMNDYLETVTLVIRKHRGTLDKYIGDAIMAFRGPPVSDSDDAGNTVGTAMEMQDAPGNLNQSLGARGMPEIRIGMHAGGMTVGDMGSLVRKAYTVMGDAVNLGARPEGITRRCGVDTVAGEASRHAVDDIVFRELDLVQVKGKQETGR
jgi:adenylate cyclase